MNHADQGGAALALYDLIAELKKSTDIEAIVITGKNNNLNKMLSEIGIENYSLPFKNFASSQKHPEWLYKRLLNIRYEYGLFRTLHRIESIININAIDLIHSNLNRIDIGAILSKKYHIPHLWHIREYGEQDFKLTYVKNKPYLYMESFESEYIAISEGVKNHWICNGLSAKRMHLVYDGIREELYPIVRNKTSCQDFTRMIFLGGYCKSKGQEELIEALHLLPSEILSKIKMDFFGNGKDSYINYLKNKIVKYNMSEQVTLFHYDSNIWKKVPDYQIGFNCSMAEGFGRVTVEYMMSGLCVIASDKGANQELIQNGKTGLIYRKSDYKDLAMKIKYAVSHKSEMINYGKNAQNYAKEHFSMKKHAQMVVNLYHHICNL